MNWKSPTDSSTEYHARGFRSRHQFTAMLFGQLSSQDSLRGIEAGLASQAAALYPLGVRPVHRSTLALANEHRSHEHFLIIFQWMLSKCQPLAPKHTFRFKNPLYSIDATTKGAVKLHVKLNHSGYLPTFAVMTTGKAGEQTIAPHELSFS